MGSRLEAAVTRNWVRLRPSGRVQKVPLSEAEDLACDIIKEVEAWVDAGRDGLALKWLVMEVAAIAFGAEKANCQHCGEPYITGRMTGRRSTALFCSEACQKAAARERDAG